MSKVPHQLFLEPVIVHFKIVRLKLTWSNKTKSNCLSNSRKKQKSRWTEPQFKIFYFILSSRRAGYIHDICQPSGQYISKRYIGVVGWYTESFWIDHESLDIPRVTGNIPRVAEKLKLHSTPRLVVYCLWPIYLLIYWSCWHISHKYIIYRNI